MIGITFPCLFFRSERTLLESEKITDVPDPIPALCPELFGEQGILHGELKSSFSSIHLDTNE